MISDSSYPPTLHPLLLMASGEPLIQPVSSTRLSCLCYRLVEFFSPLCPHCRKFEPTWRELTEKYDPQGQSTDFHMAQVNCIAQGGPWHNSVGRKDSAHPEVALDLCSDNKIAHYPEIKL